MKPTRLTASMKSPITDATGPMKSLLRNPFVLPMLAAFLGLWLTGQLLGETFKTLHSFGGTNGIKPEAELILLGSTLYGTASTWLHIDETAPSGGTVFAISTDGSGFTNLYTFAADGFGGLSPLSGLASSGTRLYGTAQIGGSFDGGTVFALSIDGAGFTVLHPFTRGTDGREPYGGLILSQSTLYGTTISGGASSNGTVFAVNPDGTGFTTLYSFTETPSPYYTNSDGACPLGGLVLSDNILYGTANGGGGSDKGTVFALTTTGTDFRLLHSFSDISGNAGTNSDGTFPLGRLVLSSNTLYGTCAGGGIFGGGTVFKVGTDGTGFSTLHSFPSSDNISNTNSEGSNPMAPLILSGSTLLGAAVNGGVGPGGTVFSLNTDGTGFRIIHSFAGTDGQWPLGGLLLSENTLYGTTANGGALGWGTVFSISLLPQLTITRLGLNTILTWPTSASGFTLQFATNLVSPVAWTSLDQAPAVVNGYNTVTNTATSTQLFYRLIQ